MTARAIAVAVIDNHQRRTVTKPVSAPKVKTTGQLTYSASVERELRKIAGLAPTMHHAFNPLGIAVVCGSQDAALRMSALEVIREVLESCIVTWEYAAHPVADDYVRLCDKAIDHIQQQRRAKAEREAKACKKGAKR